MKGEFVAVVSHELRTPITAMIGYAKTLRQPQFANDEILREEFLGRMERQGNRLVGLVENLLTTSRLESDQLSISIGRVLFEDLCRETVEGLGTDVDRVVTDVPDDIPVLHTDRQLLSRVITNLLDNALKYSPEGALCELGARSQGDELVFWVRDHGIGIEPEQMGRIFERFYQVDSSSTRRFSGAGLGLSMVRDLVHHLGGTVSVESAPDQGSTFTVNMPIQAPDAEAATG
jgi:two-component system phosphate regulon sensor histidine kinase PhoR